MGSVFLPLRACKRKNRETPVENLDNYDDDLGFRGAKLANKALGVLGMFKVSIFISFLLVLLFMFIDFGSWLYCW